MHVGMATVFQNTGRALSDHQIYLNELALADMAEPLGFESIWGVEHHFTDYTMCPDVVQFLSYMAGRTKHVRLGSMVVVLPWHDPMRVAEQVSMLDHLSGGRMILGLGRGAGKVEFDGFRLDMGDSRELFVEYGEALLKGLESGVMEYHGKHYRQPATAIRPAPYKILPRPHLCRGRQPRERAHHGQARRRPPDHPAEAVARGREGAHRVQHALPRDQRQRRAAADLGRLDLRRRKRRAGARDGDEIHRRLLPHGARPLPVRGAHMKNQRGYEYYAKMNEKLAVYGDQKAIEFFADLQVYGTPEQVYDKVLAIHKQTNNSAYVGVFSYAGMPHEEAARNMRLFAATVMPELRKFDAGATIDRVAMLPDLRFAVAAE